MRKGGRSGADACFYYYCLGTLDKLDWVGGRWFMQMLVIDFFLNAPGPFRSCISRFLAAVPLDRTLKYLPHLTFDCLFSRNISNLE